MQAGEIGGAIDGEDLGAGSAHLRWFSVHGVDARFASLPTRSMEVMGFDAVKQQHVARSFDDQGATEVFALALQGRRWSIDGKTVRFHGGLDAQKNRLTGLRSPISPHCCDRP